jgi:hypothetical protein
MTPQPLTARARGIIVLVLIVLIAVAAYLVIVNSKFHVTGTNPGTAKVATISPFFKVNFNKKLSKSNLSVSSEPSVIKSYDVDGKVLVINLNTPLIAGKSYSVNVKSIQDTAGETLTDKNFGFIPQVIEAQDLPKDQADAILKAQASRPRTRNDINFTGLDNLISRGVSLTQLDDLKQAVFQFKPSTANSAINNVKAVPHDPNSSTQFDTINFSIKLDSDSYSARIEYSNLTILRLYLYNSAGGLVFDSKNVSLDY